jgi:hypothetical protein
MHIAPACTGSGEGSDHFRSYVRSLSMHFGRRLLPGLELMTSWSQGNNITVAPGLPFINGTPSVTPQGFVSCNHTLIMDVIKGLNQFGINSIKFTSNSKIRSEFDFSFEFCWPLVKVFNTKVVPNNPFYLQKNSHNFLRCLSIFPNFLSTSALIRNCFRKI